MKNKLVRYALLFVFFIPIKQSLSQNNQWSVIGQNFKNPVFKIVQDKFGNIYGAGDFVNANMYHYVAKWNGTSWVELGGLNSLKVTRPIFSIAVDTLGNVYAGGSFINSNGNYYVAKYDGVKWSQVGTGSNALLTNFVITALMVNPKTNHLFVGGDSTLSGSSTLAKWDGISWSNTFTGFSYTGSVYDITCNSNGETFVASKLLGSNYTITKINGTNVNYNSSLIFNAKIRSIITDNIGNLYAAGNFVNLNGYYYVAKVDTSLASYSEVGLGLDTLKANTSINSIGIDKYNNLYSTGVVKLGYHYVSKWDGLSWKQLGVRSHKLYVNTVIRSIIVDTATNVFASYDSYFLTFGKYMFFVAKFSQVPCSSTNNFISASICKGAEYEFHGYYFDTTGTYNVVLFNYLGCDSIVTINLTVGPNSISSDTIYLTICNDSNFVFNGSMPTISGTYYDTLTNYMGCDSIINLILKVIPTSATTINYSVCNGIGSIFFKGAQLTAAGTYFDTLINYLGCDSLVTLQLKNGVSSYSTIFDSSCQGKPYFFHFKKLTVAGVYTDTIINFNGCDSIVTLNLTFNPVGADTVIKNINAGNTYLFNNHYLTSSGIYLDTSINVFGCDSITTLVLNVANGIGKINHINKVDIHPNPSSNEITVSFKYSTQNATIKIINIFGQVISQKLNQSGDKFYFDLSEFSNGIYIVEIIIGQSLERIKIIKK
jgi:hypothetical protein